MYEELVKSLRLCTSDKRGYGCAEECAYGKKHPLNWWCVDCMLKEAADAIEELQKLNCELLFRVGQAEALIVYYQTGRMISNEPPNEES